MQRNKNKKNRDGFWLAPSGWGAWLAGLAGWPVGLARLEAGWAGWFAGWPALALNSGMQARRQASAYCQISEHFANAMCEAIILKMILKHFYRMLWQGVLYE